MTPVQNFIVTQFDYEEIEKLAEKKVSLIQQVINEKTPNANSILSLSYNPVIVDLALQGYEVTCLTNESIIVKHLDFINDYLNLNIKTINKDFYTFCIDNVLNENQKFDIILALDQYLTNAKSEQEQIEKLKNILSLCDDNGLVITSLLDYKNLKYNDKYFSQPFLLTNKNKDKSFIIINNRHWKVENRKQWIDYNYIIDQVNDKLVSFDPMIKQAMFFKQLAYHVQELGWSKYEVYKKTLYKPIYSNVGQYLITIQR